LVDQGWATVLKIAATTLEPVCALNSKALITSRSDFIPIADDSIIHIDSKGLFDSFLGTCRVENTFWLVIVKLVMHPLLVNEATVGHIFAILVFDEGLREHIALHTRFTVDLD
jgi:hypothetical protein